jgi:hypothetical protein
MIGNLRGGIHYLEGIKGAKTGNVFSQSLPSFNISPNPSSGTVTFYANSHNILKYQVMDLNGRVVKEGNALSGQPSELASDLKNGVYFISLRDGTKLYATQKMVIAR